MTDVRTLIVDDEPVARQRLRRRAGQQPGIEIIGECANGADALRAVAQSSPDLLLLDIQMPGIDGFGVVEGLAPGPLPIIVFAAPEPRKFLVRSGQPTSFISPEEIDWIEADGNYAILHVGGRNHLLRTTMSALETQLPVDFFPGRPLCHSEPSPLEGNPFH